MKYLFLAGFLLISVNLFADTTVANMLGDVKFQSQGSSTWQNVKNGQRINIGDTIQTGAKSFAEINTNDNIIRIQPKTKVRFTQEMVNNKPQGSMSLFAGSVNCKMDKLKKSGDGYKVNTPSSVCGVRGTEFDVATSADGKTVLQVTEGTVALEGMSKAVLVAKNQESAVAIGGEPEPVKIIKRKDWEKWANESSSDVRGKEKAILDGCLLKIQKLDSDIAQLEKERDVAKAKSDDLFAKAKSARDAGDNDTATKLAIEGEKNFQLFMSSNRIAFYQASRIELVKEVADNVYKSFENKSLITETYNSINEIYTRYFERYIQPIIETTRKRQELLDKRKKK
jgi:hypothetical protein